MKPTVMTTGPGVIIATATASTNCRSLSHRWSWTTPPYRNGTMASPLPNTNAPAFAKKAPSWPRSDQSNEVATAQVDDQWGLRAARPDTAFRPNQRFGGARTSHASNPPPRNSHTLSDSDQTV